MPDLETVKREIFKVYPNWVYEMEHSSDGKLYAIYSRLLNAGKLKKEKK